MQHLVQVEQAKNVAVVGNIPYLAGPCIVIIDGASSAACVLRRFGVFGLGIDLRVSKHARVSCIE